jgi:hypothetical protein
MRASIAATNTNSNTPAERRTLVKITHACLALVVGLAALAIVSAGLAAKPKVGPAPPKLYGAVGQSKTVTLKDAHGKTVLRLKPGWYTLTISDASANQRFKLKGPGVNRSTGGPFVGAAIWGVKLRKGTYSYQTVGAKNGSRNFRVA